LLYICHQYKYKLLVNPYNQLAALVCGGSKGIGNASALKLAEMGYNVTLVARNEADLKSAVMLLPTNGTNKHNYIAIDTNDIENLILKIKAKSTEIRFPYLVLINNSGGPAAGQISNAKNEEFEAAFRQHLLVNHSIVMLLKDEMINAKFGRIINIISTSVKQPLPNLGVSNTIRAAVANWSKTLASELAQHCITVNNVLPGATSTDRLAAIIKNKSTKLNLEETIVEKEMLHEIPMGRFAKPEEVAAAVAFLASNDASYITGINIPVDGGRTGCL
jgi:3-oxoacyl-[acyl-carrier protein] reductase